MKCQKYEGKCSSQFTSAQCDVLILFLWSNPWHKNDSSPNDKEKQQILTSEKLKPASVRIDQLSNCCGCSRAPVYTVKQNWQARECCLTEHKS